MLAQRAGCPVLPVYIQRRRAPFSSLHMVIGQPYLVETADRRATAEELRQQTDLLMKKIYTMGENVG